MVEPINLNRARKAKARAAAEAVAAANRQKFGRTKAEKLNDAAAVTRLGQTLDKARRDDLAVLVLRPARSDEVASISDLCLRSKAVWGYDAAFLEACRPSLTLTAEDLSTSHVQVAEQNGALVGVAQIVIEGETAALDKLFVEPARLRTGAGKRLFQWARDMALRAGASRLLIDADPGAAGFYRRMGAVEAGLTPSEVFPGRMIPRLSLDMRPAR